MSDTMKQAEALVNIAFETYTQEIAPGLPPARRYAGAMVTNALGIAQRRLGNPDPGNALVENLGVESLEFIAKALREGKISTASYSELQNILLNYLEAELAITNPKFLNRRKGK